MERDDGDDDGQNAGKRCQARIILEWKGGRERVPPRRRQPFTCKSSTSFLHTLPSSSLPLDFFVPPPQSVDFHPPIFFFFTSFPHPFLAACTFSQHGARGLREWARNNGTCEGAILIPYSARRPKVAFINLFRVYVNSYAQPANLRRVHFHQTSHFLRARGAIGELRLVKLC